MSKINYLVGDATEPVGEGNKIIAHGCNDQGGWGAGFVLALSAKWKEPEEAYRNMAFRDLGVVQFVAVAPDIRVVNMITQHGTRGKKYGNRPLRYLALATCLDKLAGRAVHYGASVHMPRIGCGLAGGDWTIVEALVEDTLGREGVPVFVYDLE